MVSVDDLPTTLAQILNDYRDGLLDSVEDGVEAILALEPIADALAMVRVPVMEKPA